MSRFALLLICCVFASSLCDHGVSQTTLPSPLGNTVWQPKCTLSSVKTDILVGNDKTNNYLRFGEVWFLNQLELSNGANQKVSSVQQRICYIQPLFSASYLYILCNIPFQLCYKQGSQSCPSGTQPFLLSASVVSSNPFTAKLSFLKAGGVVVSGVSMANSETTKCLQINNFGPGALVATNAGVIDVCLDLQCQAGVLRSCDMSWNVRIVCVDPAQVSAAAATPKR